MEVSDTCFVSVKDGVKLNKWEVHTIDAKSKFVAKKYTFYYFATKAKAELYREYLMSRECLKTAKKNARNRLLSKDDRKSWQSLADSINLEEFEAKVANINPIITTKSIKCMM